MNLTARLKPYVVYVFLFLCGVVPYLPALRYSFYRYWDDSAFVFNGHMEMNAGNLLYWLTHTTIGGYTPVAMYSLMVDYALWGPEAWGFRLHGLVLHGINVLLFFYLLRRFRCSDVIAVVAAMLFAIHPQRLESLIWIAERRDQVFVLFYLLTLICYMRGLDRGRDFSWLGLGLAFLSFFAKPMAFSLPLVLTFYTIWRDRTFAWRPVLVRVWPYYLAAGVYYSIFEYFSRTFSVVRDIGAGVPLHVSLVRVPLVPLHNLGWYLQATLFPADVNPIYHRVLPDAGTAVLIALLLVAVGVTLLSAFGVIRGGEKLFPRYGTVAFWGAYAAVLGPVVGLVVFNDTDFCDRYSYLPSMIVLAGLARWFSDRRLTGPWAGTLRRLIMLLTLIYLAYVVGLTLSLLGVWSDNVNVFRKAASAAVPNPRAIAGLGGIGLAENRPGLMMEAGKRLMAYSRLGVELNMPPEIFNRDSCYCSGLAYYGIGLARTHQYGMATEVLGELVDQYRNSRLTLMFPESTRITAFAELANSWLALNNKPKALEALECLLGTAGEGTYEQYFYTGLIHYLRGNYRAALEAYTRAARLRPDDRNIAANLDAARKKLAANEKR